jgi:predicted DCC family thiol-disulfide oxidoreductase YuxK
VGADSELLLVYDGDCGFCSASARWVSGKWTGVNRAHAIPWQELTPSGLAELGLTEDDVACAAWWFKGGLRFRGHLAVAHSLLLAGSGWRLVGRLLLAGWVQRPAAYGYEVVVRNRYHLPGGSAACRV